ncbi:adenylosuccinate lyase [bacterium]|nr:adenylosuccinate lyase [candidate division CSSED10-310 bacterium]
MIERYSTPEMSAIWSDDNKYKQWLEIEIAVCRAKAELGLIPSDAAQRISQKARYDCKAIQAEEEKSRHDVIAFVTVVNRSLEHDSCYFHEGMTSSDLLDTALAMQLVEASNLINRELWALIDVIAYKAKQYKSAIMIGRTHGVHAEPITFGLKLAVWFQDLKRISLQFEQSMNLIRVGKLSGAVGNFAHLSPEIESIVCDELNLNPELAATQVVQRDRHAVFVSTLAVMAGICEKFAIELRHLQRSEVLEVEEPFGRDQKGSSAMPHKKNPILSENVTGLCRLVRSYASSALENIPLWHERDISHSSVERIILPDTTTAMHFILKRLTFIIKHMTVNTERMRKNLDLLNGLIFSQRVLLALTQKGLSREKAYTIVQRLAMLTWNGQGTFQENVESESQINTHFSKDEINGWFDLSYYLKHVEYIFHRAGLDSDEE